MNAVPSNDGTTTAPISYYPPCPDNGPSGYKSAPSPGHKYKIVRDSRNFMDHAAATSYCANHNATLATFSNQADFDWFQNLPTDELPAAYYWIGLEQIGSGSICVNETCDGYENKSLQYVR